MTSLGQVSTQFFIAKEETCLPAEGGRVLVVIAMEIDKQEAKVTFCLIQSLKDAYPW